MAGWKIPELNGGFVSYIGKSLISMVHFSIAMFDLLEGNYMERSSIFNRKTHELSTGPSIP